MSEHYDGGSRVLCPFYQMEGRKSISCEGLVPRSNITLGYYHTDDKKRQRATFCDQKYENCEVYQMLLKKYE